MQGGLSEEFPQPIPIYSDAKLYCTPAFSMERKEEDAFGDAGSVYSGGTIVRFTKGHGAMNYHNGQ